jgi:transposase
LTGPVVSFRTVMTANEASCATSSSCVVSAPADDRPMIIGRQRALMRSTPGMYENMAISRALRKLGLLRKKKLLQAQERHSPKVRRKRREFRKEVAGLGARRLVLVDESGAHTAMTRTHGQAPAGQRVHGAVPGRWETVTLICGLRLSGVAAPAVFQHATDTDTFESYVEQVLVPELEPGDVVIWGDIQPPKAATVMAAVEAAGARVIPMPPSSPDLTPIEQMFSKVKGALRSAAAARTAEAVTVAIGTALHDVSSEGIEEWFPSRAAYAFQP